jgi:hypothetical protein
MKVGFTGSRKGMTESQRDQLIAWLDEFWPTEFHHGCCIGSDAEAHGIATIMSIRTVGHPPTETKYLGAWESCDERRDPFPYLVRNRHIVNETELLIATPCDPRGTPHSGTWYTVEFAESVGRKVIIL